MNLIKKLTIGLLVSGVSTVSVTAMKRTAGITAPIIKQKTLSETIESVFMDYVIHGRFEHNPLIADTPNVYRGGSETLKEAYKQAIAFYRKTSPGGAVDIQAAHAEILRVANEQCHYCFGTLLGVSSMIGSPKVIPFSHDDSTIDVSWWPNEPKRTSPVASTAQRETIGCGRAEALDRAIKGELNPETSELIKLWQE